MKKLYFILLFAVGFLNSLVAQQTYLLAPNGTLTSSTNGPNGTAPHTTYRGCFLIKASELSSISTITALNSVGFRLNGSTGPAVTGTIQVYLENTGDGTYLKGTNWNTAVAPMTSVYNNTMTVPGSTFLTTVNLPLPAPFTYTGGGIYVAYEWEANGPFAASPALYRSDNSLSNPGAFVATSAPPAGTLMTVAASRPNFNLGYINTYTNEASVRSLYGVGKLPIYNGTPYTFSATIRNNCAVTMTNVVPTISITGANPYVATTTISSIGAYGQTTALFTGYTPTAQGVSTVQVFLPPDENNTNNEAVPMTQSVTCNYYNYAPPVPNTSFNQGVGFSTSAGLIVSRMRVPNNSTLTAVKLGVPNVSANNGNSIYAVLTNNFGTILATTNTITLNSGMYNTYQLFTFSSPMAINANTDYHIGLAQPANTTTAYFPLASMPASSINIPTNQYSTSNIGGGFLSSLTPTLGYFAIEGVFYNGIDMTLTPQSSTICSGNSVTLTAGGATSYSWSNGASGSSVVVSPSLVTVYTATGTVGGCEALMTSVVYVNITPTINCPNGAICPSGGSHTLSPTGASTYTFSGGSDIVSPTVTTTYTITGTSGAGCPASNTAVATVSVGNSASVSISGPTLICAGLPATLTCNGAISFSWNTGSTASYIVVAPPNLTSYTVLGTFGNCTNTAVHTLSVSNNPTSLGAGTSHTLLCVGQTATLSGLGAETYTWSVGQIGLTATVSPTVTTTYTLIGAINGICTKTITFTQNVDECIGFAEHPGALTEIKIYPNPNNGAFKVYVSKQTDNSSVNVYNGLGELILSEKLNGTSIEMDLKTLAKGVYFVKLKENDKVIRTGRIIIQ